MTVAGVRSAESVCRARRMPEGRSVLPGTAWMVRQAQSAMECRRAGAAVMVLVRVVI
ncbi:hypothetical protein [Nitratireductor aquibiodomus]|uniref:hypothetical protein n=1 Tax=Nitratireductor aquibiodomus TaxID=204799 RepID=UPI0012FD9738|nr:hypothetical protein [Nitratireductor aquibiodomus]